MHFYVVQGTLFFAVCDIMGMCVVLESIGVDVLHMVVDHDIALRHYMPAHHDIVDAAVDAVVLDIVVVVLDIVVVVAAVVLDFVAYAVGDVVVGHTGLVRVLRMDVLAHGIVGSVVRKLERRLEVVRFGQHSA